MPAPLRKNFSSMLLRIGQQAISKQHWHLLLRPLETAMPLKLSLHIGKNALQVRSWL